MRQREKRSTLRQKYCYAFRHFSKINQEAELLFSSDKKAYQRHQESKSSEHYSDTADQIVSKLVVVAVTLRGGSTGQLFVKLDLQRTYPVKFAVLRSLVEIAPQLIDLACVGFGGE